MGYLYRTRRSVRLHGRDGVRCLSTMIRLALFLLPYAPRRLRPWLMGIAFGRKPEQMEFREGKWRFPDAP